MRENRAAKCMLGKHVVNMAQLSEVFENISSSQGSMILQPKDIPGAIIVGAFEAQTAASLKRWLQCRGASLKGEKRSYSKLSSAIMTLIAETEGGD